MYKAALPSFKEQVAYVYNDYMSTLGGGERSALAFALALRQLDFEVEILCGGTLPSQEQVVKIFGEEFAQIKMRQIPSGTVVNFAKSAQPTVFINHTYMSFVRSPAKVGIYAQMFPNTVLNRLTHPNEVASLSSYSYMASNSSFTKRYADMYWEYPSDRSVVLAPPIGAEFVAKARHLGQNLPQKDKVFVHVGRFNPGNHNKNQRILIEAFTTARKRYDSLKDWRLKLVGNVNQTPESLEYFESCQNLARESGGAVEIHPQLSATELSQVMQQAFGYVHATGAFLAPGVEPHKCEHYGLSIVEAMAHGAIPLVYARGGIFDVLDVGTMGIPYISLDGLIEGFEEVASRYGTSQALEMQRACLAAAAEQGQENFTHELAKLITNGLRR